MNYNKNFKPKDMIYKIICFTVYIPTAGILGSVASLIAGPFIVFFSNDSITNDGTLLYLISAVIAFSVLFFFAAREGYIDTENLKYLRLRTTVSFMASGMIFGLLLFFYINSSGENGIFGYIFNPYYFIRFLNAENYASLYNFFYTPVILSEQLNEEMCATILNVVAMAGIGCMILPLFFYETGRVVWVSRKKRKIKSIKKKQR